MPSLRSYLVTVRTPVATVHHLVPALSVADARARAGALGSDVRVHTSAMEAQPTTDEKVQPGAVAFQTRKMRARENFIAAIFLPVALGVVLVPLAAWLHRFAGLGMLALALAGTAYLARAAAPGLLFARFRAALREDRFDDAERELSRVVRLSKGVDHPLWGDLMCFQQAQLAAARGDRALTMTLLERLSMNDERQALDYRGAILLQLRERDAALEAFARAADLGSTAAAIELAWQTAVAREPAPSVPPLDYDDLIETERGWMAMTEALRAIDDGRRDWALRRVAEARAQLELTLLTEESEGVLAFCDGVAALAMRPSAASDLLVASSRRVLEKSCAGRGLLARLDASDQPVERIGDTSKADQVEEDGPASMPCTVCRTPIDDAYFEIDSRVTCSSCHDAFVIASAQAGTAATRFFRALGLGVLAAVVGSGIYFAVRKTTGYEIGLIGIVVGFLVGGAVRSGSGGRGGRGFQVLAVILTYLAIVSTYVPDVVRSVRQAAQEQAAPAPSASAPAHPLDLAEPEPSAPSPANDPAPPPRAGRAVTVVAIAFAVVVVFVIACAAPFLAGAANILGLVIIGFSLFQAWKMNRRTDPVITGPHPLVRAGETLTGAIVSGSRRRAGAHTTHASDRRRPLFHSVGFACWTTRSAKCNRPRERVSACR